MSKRFEQHSSNPFVEFAPAGTEIGYDDVPDGEVAIIIGDPDGGASVLCGPPDELVAWLTSTTDLVRAEAGLAPTPGDSVDQ